MYSYFYFFSGLSEGMSARFGSFEARDAYSVSTYCDPRWKDVFFQNTETNTHVESVLAEEILAKVKGITDLNENTHQNLEST